MKDNGFEEGKGEVDGGGEEEERGSGGEEYGEEGGKIVGEEKIVFLLAFILQLKK
jgi:hypothetical protein